jgi:diguanylate cyclase (GGDEF)-like protein/putative nucleotidyltransferase with HDIG domain
LISVDNFVTGRPIEREQAAPLLALANQLGTAVERARVLESERTERARLQALLESARALNSTLDSDRILDVLATTLVSTLGAAVAHFSHVDRRQRRLYSLATHAVNPQAPVSPDAARSAPARFAAIEQVLNTRRPHVGLVPRSGDEVRRGDLSAAQSEGHTELLVPLVVQEEAMGVLEVSWSRPVTISPDTVELCVAIADQASLAINNARLYAEATRQAERDPLTGLLNHRTLLEQLDARLALAEPFALLLIDVNDFKLFNDTHGHLVGDAVLIQVASLLHEVCREHDRAARYGGDEFAVVLQGVSHEEAGAVARRLESAIRSHPHVTDDGDTIPLSASIGVACYPIDGRTCQELVAVADAQMYAAKHSELLGGETGRSTPDRVTLTHRGAADLLGDSPFGVLEGLVDAVNAKDRYTREHSDDVVRLALGLAVALDLDAEQRRVLALAAALHDVGKIAVPGRILRKPGRLSDEEYEAVKRHVTYGVALIRGVMENEQLVEAVAYHHERWDGGGYPTGLRGGHTPLLARVMQLADAASAMRLDRPYRRGLSSREVVAELRAGAGTQFDPALVEPFVRVVTGLTDDVRTA